MPAARPKLIDASLGVYAWPGHEDIVHVLDGEHIAYSFVGVPDRDLDALLDHVAGEIVLGEGEGPLDLVVIRGHVVVGVVHRRPGRPSTYTRCDDRLAAC